MSALERASELSPDEAPSYTPVSAFAASGFIVALLGAVAMAGLWSAGRMTGKPVYNWSLLVLPFVGFVLGVLGYRQITRSEGTRTGKKLAYAALWIAGLSGICYLSYLMSIEFAMRANAAAAFQEWVAKAKEGPPELAMLAMLEPGVRSGVDSKNLEAIRTRFAREWQLYNNFEIVRVISRAGQRSQVDVRGIKEWAMDQGGYIVKLLVTVRTPEGKFEYAFPVFGRDTPELGRSWSLAFSRVEPISFEMTSLGRLTYDMQIRAREHLVKWVESIDHGKLSDAFVQTLPLAERTAPPATDAPAYKAFIDGSIIRIDGKQPIDEDRKKYAAELVQINHINPTPGNAQRQVGPPVVSIIDGVVRLDHTVEIKVPWQNADVVAHVIQEVQGEKLLAELNKLHSSTDWANQPTSPNRPDGSDIEKYKPFGFRIVAVDIRPNEPRLVQPLMPPGS